MKQNLRNFIASTSLFFLLAQNSQAIILGPTDDRVEFFELSTEWQDMAKSTVAFVPATKIGKINPLDKNSSWTTSSIVNSIGNDPQFVPAVHSKYRFINQPILADCTGFMITQDIMITAAHCLPDGYNTAGIKKSTYIVSDLVYESQKHMTSNSLNFKFSSEQINAIEEVLFWGKPTAPKAVSDTDYAIVKLKKPFLNIQPLKLKRNYMAAFNAQIGILGYGLGLPLKGNTVGRIAVKTDVQQKIFRTFLDTGGGNSGGPVFDNASRSVIGIYIASPSDWVPCDRSTLYSRDTCESNAPETVEQIASDKNAPKSFVEKLREKFPDGIITSYTNQVLRIDQVIEKVIELKINANID